MTDPILGRRPRTATFSTALAAACPRRGRHRVRRARHLPGLPVVRAEDAHRLGRCARRDLRNILDNAPPQAAARLRLHRPDLRRQGLDLPAARADAGLRAAAARRDVQPQLVLQTGRYNLENALERFDVDHVQFTPARSLVNRLARQSLAPHRRLLLALPRRRRRVPAAGGRALARPAADLGRVDRRDLGPRHLPRARAKFDRDYFTARLGQVDRRRDGLGDGRARGARGRSSCRAPRSASDVGLVGIHLGDYLFWDDERQMEFVRDTYGWSERQGRGHVQGLQERRVPDGRPARLHEVPQARLRPRRPTMRSADVRNGPDHPRGGFRARQPHDPDRPDALDYYLEITGLTEDEFYTR